ncbi:hypothetical protein BJP34_32915 [Moorena producens PAL-8-15-08-1]|uniref:Uncharacterized protein n=1 Tax=Moorena producens PAL-8-15-08-1 TaxID=1458985 RepID=A0A1D8U1C1_9CYAN|nr:hypothetical protein BJP34_32915 [Moorena producens PAL-8-15-08-1]
MSLVDNITLPTLLELVFFLHSHHTPHLIRVGFLQRPQVLGLGCGVWGVGYKKAMQLRNRGFPPETKPDYVELLWLVGSLTRALE